MCEPTTVTKKVCKTVPETVCETQCVPGKWVWASVPVYECVLDPCTCSHVRKQVGTRRERVREPNQTVTRQVTRNKTVVEEVQETLRARGLSLRAE